MQPEVSPMSSPYERWPCETMHVRTGTIWWATIKIVFGLWFAFIELMLSRHPRGHFRGTGLVAELVSFACFGGTITGLLDFVTGVLALCGAVGRCPSFLIPLLIFSVLEMIASCLLIIGSIFIMLKETTEKGKDALEVQIGLFLFVILMDLFTIENEKSLWLLATLTFAESEYCNGSTVLAHLMSSPYERCPCGMMHVRTGTIWQGTINILSGLCILVIHFRFSSLYSDIRSTSSGLVYLIAGILAVYGALKRRPNFLLPMLIFSLAWPSNRACLTALKYQEVYHARHIIGTHEIGFLVLLISLLMDACAIGFTYMCFKHFKYQPKDLRL
uniref:Tetraspanin n=1 Tax=Steinernema glaseri TaxID=37863 RepID=A0A1I7ZUK1_9BILA